MSVSTRHTRMTAAELLREAVWEEWRADIAIRLDLPRLAVRLRERARRLREMAREEVR